MLTQESQEIEDSTKIIDKNIKEIESQVIKKDWFENLATAMIIGGFIIVIVGGIYEYQSEKSVHEALGYFGEYVGGISGSIWTLAGVILFYTALNRQNREFLLQRDQLQMQRTELVMQREELKLQRLETELQRKEFERQTEQLKTQNATLSIQKFENTFFQLLGLHNEIVNSNESRDLGKDWAKKLYLRFIGKYQRLEGEDSEEQERLDESYRLFPKRTEYLDRYCNNIFYLIQFIDKSDIEDKQFYTSIIRAQLTIYEQLLLLYFSLSSLASPNLKVLIEEYGLLKDLPFDEIISQSHKNFFKPSAFGL